MADPDEQSRRFIRNKSCDQWPKKYQHPYFFRKSIKGISWRLSVRNAHEAQGFFYQSPDIETGKFCQEPFVR